MCNKLLTVNGLVRGPIHITIRVDLQMKAVLLRRRVQVHQTICASPAGIQQWRGVGKGSYSLQAAQDKEHEVQAAVLTGLQHGALFLVAGAVSETRYFALLLFCLLFVCIWSVSPQMGSQLFSSHL